MKQNRGAHSDRDMKGLVAGQAAITNRNTASGQVEPHLDFGLSARTRGGSPTSYPYFTASLIVVLDDVHGVLLHRRDQETAPSARRRIRSAIRLTYSGSLSRRLTCSPEIELDPISVPCVSGKPLVVTAVCPLGPTTVFDK